MSKIMIVALMLTSSVSSASPNCLKHLTDGLARTAFRMIDHAHGYVFPDRTPPGEIREARRAAHADVRTKAQAFARMPHDLAKFNFALRELEHHALRAKNLGPAHNLNRIEQYRSQGHLALIRVYFVFVEQIVLRRLSGGRHLVDIDDIPMTDDDDRYAREVLARVNEAEQVVFGPSLRSQRTTQE